MSIVNQHDASSISHQAYGSTEASAQEVATARLGNGMDVVVIPDPRVPIVTHMVWYRTGSADDPIGKSGIAHFLEHLMFKGTACHPAGAFSTRIAEMGGQENAFTTIDFTAYFQRVPKEHLSTCMAFEADRMCNLALSEAVVAPERDVVLEERQMRTDTDPASLIDEAVQASLFRAHPSGRPIIGWRHEIETLGRDDALAHYARFYAPENAILIVAGDVESRSVLDLAQTYYGLIPAAGQRRERSRPRDPESKSHQTVTLVDPKVRQSRLIRRHAVPSYKQDTNGTADALAIVSQLLGSGMSGLLHRRLVMERRLANSIRTSYWGTALDLARFNIEALPAAGVSPQSLDAAIDDVLADLEASGFDQDDVGRAKLQILADSAFNRDSQVGVARLYGTSLSVGLPLSHITTLQQRIEACSPDTLRHALVRLRPQTGVSGYLLGPARAAA